MLRLRTVLSMYVDAHQDDIQLPNIQATRTESEIDPYVVYDDCLPGSSVRAGSPNKGPVSQLYETIDIMKVDCVNVYDILNCVIQK